MSASFATLKGFRDLLPEQKLAKDFLIGKLTEVFRLHGFVPIETPTLEYADLLLGKYGSEADKLVYQFTDRGGRRVALRYDQTVPTARFLVNHRHQLPRFFLRYQIQNVFRAEKPQKGRFREFAQCDIDVFDSDSSMADALVLATAYHGYQALGLGQVNLLVNHRSSLIAQISPFASDSLPVMSIIQTIDKLDKLPLEKVKQELSHKGMDSEQIEQLFAKLDSATPSPELQEIISLTSQLGVPSDSLCFRPYLARGLDYYTGMIVEVVYPQSQLGSIGGGGRYDQLIEQIAGQAVPAVGFSFGIDRMLELMQQQQLLPDHLYQPPVMLAVYSEQLLPAVLELYQQLVQNAVPTVIYPQTGDKLSKQYKYADQLKCQYVILIGPEENQADQVSVKHLPTGEQQTLPQKQLISWLQQRLRPTDPTNRI